MTARPSLPYHLVDCRTCLLHAMTNYLLLQLHKPIGIVGIRVLSEQKLPTMDKLYAAGTSWMGQRILAIY